MARRPPPPFGVEQWMDSHETWAVHNLAETCVASISLDELVGLSEDKDAKLSDIVDSAAPQLYGEIRGSIPLRDNLSRLYSTKVGTPLRPNNILITHGAIAANHLAFYALLSQGDHVICQYPVYQQLYAVPESLGAEVSLWKCKPENDWVPDFDELKAMVTDQTKMIIINNPVNPTGTILPKSLLTQIVELAESKNILIFSDEVYRPLFHGITPMDKDFPPSLLSLGYAKTLVSGSLSKAYSLAGLRVGWLAGRDAQTIEACARARDYTTISVGALPQAAAAFALHPNVVHALLGRNIQLAKANLALLDRFVVKHDEFCTWTRPRAGTTAFIRFARDGRPVDARVFCEELQKSTGVMLLPGDEGFGDEFRGYVRFGYCNSTEVVKEGLEALRSFMRKMFDDMPLHED